MTSKSGIDGIFLRKFLEEFMEQDETYRSGDIYREFMKKNNGEPYITKKDFAMLLRSQVMKEDGFLKRVAHGVYQIRTDPNDRGIFFTQEYGKNRHESITDDLPCSPLSTENAEISSNEILNDALNLTRKIAFSFDQISKDEFSCAEKCELIKLKDSLLKSMTTTITGIAEFMALCDGRA